MKTRGLTVVNRWAESGLHTLVVMERTTVEVARQTTTCETSYYATNQQVETAQHAVQSDLAQVIRGHWGGEAANWIRDVTFNEDHIKTRDGNQAQILASLRTLAIRLLRKARFSNLQAALEVRRGSIRKLLCIHYGILMLLICWKMV
ncbi:MAG: hypothetical protein KKD28_04345 [Chloroflexi bacterium]|nr:hypothetical protein [Chloroflexota bacterium]